MFNLLIFTLVGVGAQLVDGALGMAFGVTATTLLLFSGVGPAHASAAVHLAEVGTTLVSGASHWRFRNIDWKVVLRLGVPGAIGAFLGATVLSGLSTEAAEPVTAGILLAIGVYVALRFSVRPPAVPMPVPPRTPRNSCRRWASSAASSTRAAVADGDRSPPAPCSPAARRHRAP